MKAQSTDYRYHGVAAPNRRDQVVILTNLTSEAVDLALMAARTRQHALQFRLPVKPLML